MHEGILKLLKIYFFYHKKADIFIQKLPRQKKHKFSTDCYVFYEMLNHIPLLILCPCPKLLPKHLQHCTNSAAGRCQGGILNGEGKQTKRKEISEKMCFYDPSTLELWWSGTKRTGMAFLFLSSVSGSHYSLHTQCFSCSLTTQSHTSSCCQSNTLMSDHVLLRILR